MFRKFLRQPQSLWLRKALFQIHLWTGISVGLYILVISISGSAIVFNTEIIRMAWVAPEVTPVGNIMKTEELRIAAKQVFPKLEIGDVNFSREPNRAAEVMLKRGERWRGRVFDPYTGKDLGDLDLIVPKWFAWTVKLHNDLLSGRTGRRVNGVGAVLFSVMCLTGIVLWWPGISSWRRSLTVTLRHKVGWPRFNWELHNVMGFWMFLGLLLWGISGLYLAFPEPFNFLIDYFQPLSEDNIEPRSGDNLLTWLARIHFGRAWGVGVKSVYVLLGLIPAGLFITGAVMWWNRVLKPALKSAKSA